MHAAVQDETVVKVLVSVASTLRHLKAPASVPVPKVGSYRMAQSSHVLHQAFEVDISKWLLGR